MELISRHRGILIFEGILFIILGCLAIALPQYFTFAIALIIGWLFIIAGLTLFFRLFQARDQSFWATLLSAILNLVVGVILLSNPVAGIFTLTMFLIGYFFVDGIAKSYLSFTVKPLRNWGWLLVSGLLSIILGVLLLAGWPYTAGWAIGLLVGINMLFSGISMIAFASALKRID